MEPSQPAWWRGVAAPGRVGLIVVVLLAGPLLWIALTSGDRPSSGDGRSGEVELPEPDQVDRSAADGDDEAPETAPGLGCTPLPCARWRLDGIDPRRLHLHEQLLVYVDGRRVTTLDPTDGSEVHRLDLPVPGGGRLAPSASATYIDEEYLAVAHDRVLSIIEASDGQLERQVLLDTSINAISRSGDGWTLRGIASRSTGQMPWSRLQGLDRRGQIRWTRDVETLFSLPGEADDVLAFVDDELHLVDLADGRSRWRHPLDPDRTYALNGDPLVLVDHVGDRLEILDRGSGEVLADLDVSGLDSAGRAGPWVFATTNRELLLFDPADGREMVRREHDATRPVMVDAITVGEGEERRVVVVSPYTGADRRSEQDLVEVYALDGTLLRSISIPVPVTAQISGPWPTGVASLGGRVVRVAVGLGRDLVEVDTVSGRILDERHHPLADGEVAFRFGSAVDGVFVAGTEERIRLEGPAGSITVHGTEPRLRSDDPLLVVDGDQLLRLDERLLNSR